MGHNPSIRALFKDPMADYTTGMKPLVLSAVLHGGFELNYWDEVSNDKVSSLTYVHGNENLTITVKNMHRGIEIPIPS